MKFEFYLVYIIIMSIITFILYAIDKKRAIQNKWRIKESVLLIFSFLGGALGGYVGMLQTHHKTKKWYLMLVNIFSLAIHIMIGLYLLQ